MRRSLSDTLFLNVPAAAAVVVVVAGLCASGCSSLQTTAEAEYFDPLKVTQPNRDRESATTYFKPRTADTHLSDTLQKAIQIQNERIEKLESGLAIVSTRQGVESVERETASKNKTGEEMLLALIREQNLRLDEIIEQVRLMGEKKAFVGEDRTTAPARPIERSVARASDAVAYAVYGQAVAAYNRKQYREAIRLFDAALAQGIRRSLSDNCLFWIGVSRFQLKEYRLSLAQLARVIGDRTSDKRSSALLMSGQSLDQLGRHDLAELAYARIMKEYPRSNLRLLAEKKIVSLVSKGTGRM